MSRTVKKLEAYEIALQGSGVDRFDYPGVPRTERRHFLPLELIVLSSRSQNVGDSYSPEVRR